MLKLRTQARLNFLARVPCILVMCLITSILLMNLLIRNLELVHRDLVVKERVNKGSWPGLRDSGTTALITMADPKFQDCAIQLLRTARRIQWAEPIYLLAIDYEQFDQSLRNEINELGVFVIDTRPIFDSWISNKGVLYRKVYRRLQPNKFRKMEVFLNPIFRTYDRLIFLDADGLLTNLDPMVRVSFPPKIAIMMRQNDKSFNKQSLYGNEMHTRFLTKKQLKLLKERYPDRAKTGATAYFIVDVKKLPTPQDVFSKSLDILCNFRAGFRLNDQTLVNLLFYREMEMFPYCSWDEIALMDDTQRLRDYCVKSIQTQIKLVGKKSFLYRHMSVSEKKECLRHVNLQQWSLFGTKADVDRGVNMTYLTSGQGMQCEKAMELWSKQH